MWKNTTEKCFLKTRAIRNSCSKGNYIDCSMRLLAETDMIYAYILHSKNVEEHAFSKTRMVEILRLRRRREYSSFLMWKNTRNAFYKTRAARNSSVLKREH